tara:strand:+ start:2482 stop:2658 length:177 start_codon:yes stop_codon:yes gene_type:complete
MVEENFMPADDNKWKSSTEEPLKHPSLSDMEQMLKIAKTFRKELKGIVELAKEEKNAK